MISAFANMCRGLAVRKDLKTWTKESENRGDL